MFDQSVEDLEKRFPHWQDNPYLPGFPARHRLLLGLIRRRAYGALHALMAANKLVKGKTV